MSSSDEAFYKDFLEFYLQKSTSHASIAVAAIFGVYSVLLLMEPKFLIGWIVVYIALLFIGASSLSNFVYYSRLAHFVAFGRKRNEYETKEYAKLTKEIDGITETIFKGMLTWKRRVAKDSMVQFLVFSILWFVATILPLIARVWLLLAG